MLNPSIALLISIASILVLLRLRWHPGLAIFAGSLIISLLVLPLPSIPAHMLLPFLDFQTLRLLVIVAGALTLSSLMEEKGLLAKMATAMESIGPKLAIHLIPAAIGLVPMPAGALVSATASQGLAQKLGLTPERATFINYWFRHMWEFSIPVYPGIIIASVILAVPFLSIIKILSPITVLAILSGAVISYVMLRKTKKIEKDPNKNIVFNLIRASWPILLLLPLILLGLEAMIAFPVTLALLALQQRVKWRELGKAFRYGVNPKIMFLLYAVMFYKAIIESSGAALALFSDMQNIGLPAITILIALPFLIGFATGISMAFVGVAFPLLVPFIVLDSGINSQALMLAYVSGMMGLFLSPLHLCLILSAEYFGARLTNVYRYVLPPILALEAIAIIIYLVAD